MGWTSPSDRSTGDTITSAIWNENVGASGNSKALRDGGIATSGQAANDIVIASSSTQLDTVAAGTAGQFLKTNGAGSAPSWATVSSPLGVAEGRLTATSGTPVTVADVSGATSIYYTPYTGNKIALYDGSAWDLFTFTEITISLSGLTASRPYDVFAYDNSGTVTIETLIWTNSTTRATNLVYQNGVLVKSGATTRRYLGSVYINATGGQTDDTVVKRYLWNHSNRHPRPMYRHDPTDSWTYTSTTFRQANANVANQLAVMIGVQEACLNISAIAVANNSGGLNNCIMVTGIGIDSTSVDSSQISGDAESSNFEDAEFSAQLVTYGSVGYHYYAWLEKSQVYATTTWIGDNGGNGGKTGRIGWVEG